MSFMGGPKTQPLPAPPTNKDAEVMEAARRKRIELLSSGAPTTVLTSGQGDKSQTPFSRLTLGA